MKEKNHYTIPLSLLGLSSIFYTSLHADYLLLLSIVPVLIIIIVLDLFPMRLLSGEEYSMSLAGFLILLLAYGMIPALAGITLSTILTHWRRASFYPQQINYFRLLSAQGKAVICLYASHAVMNGLEDVNIYLRTAAGAFIFGLLYILMVALVTRTISGVPVLTNLLSKIKELMAPVLLCTIIVPHFLKHLSLGYMMYETIYLILFVLLILFFSHGYIRQVQLRRKGTEEFIRISELRISSQNEGHGRNVGIICEHVLELLRYPKKKRVELINIAALHDIGKILLPLDILTKRGALSLSEQQEYESHPVKGAGIVANITGDQQAASWILHHHERYDGKGFPDQLQKQTIPYESRIICLCNHLEYLIREYSSNGEVIHQLRQLSGKELDPQLVGYFDTETIAWLRQYVIYNEPLVHTELTTVVHTEGSFHMPHASITGGTYLMKYTGPGSLLDHRVSGISEDILRDTEKLAERGLIFAERFYEVLSGGGNTYEAYFYPENNGLIIVLTDITSALYDREEMHRNTLHSYRDVIRTLSQSKIEICLQAEEIENQLGESLEEMKIAVRSDVALSRTMVVNHIPDLFIQHHPKKVMSIKLAVSEGVTNLIKHAAHGKVTVLRKQDNLQIYITDHGSGIPLHELPKTILVSGYSSKSSLGKGFALMYQSADRIMLHTSSEGTAILLEFRLDAEEAD